MADIKDKIKKLLALAKSPNENEAKAALLKARELMAKNKMSEDDFADKDRELKHELVDAVRWTTDSGDIWMNDLCRTLADNYCCTTAWNTRRGCRTHTLMITGFEDDVQVCREVIVYAIGFVKNAIKVLERRNRVSHATAAKSYATGFINGLREAFEEQKEQNPEWGLVVVKPQEVQDYEDSLGSKSVRTKKADFDPLAYLKGLNDGSSFNAQKILGCAE